MIINHLSPAAFEYSTTNVCPPPKGFSKKIGVISMNMACNALCSTERSGDTDPTADDPPEQYEEENLNMKYVELEEMGVVSDYEVLDMAVV